MFFTKFTLTKSHTHSIPLPRRLKNPNNISRFDEQLIINGRYDSLWCELCFSIPNHLLGEICRCLRRQIRCGANYVSLFSFGWSDHLVSKRKYHFIIQIDDEWKNGVLDVKTHILHGLIHCNGFGHLLCINASEGGSNRVCGREVMNLWERICTALHKWFW